MASSLLTIQSSFSNFKLLFLVVLFLLSPPINVSVNQFKLNGKVLELDDSNFDAAIAHFDQIFVDFCIPRCVHCKRLAPELDKAAAILAGMKRPIVVAKVDVDKYRKFGYKHNIVGFPTLKIFNHGVPAEYTGSRKADLLVKFLTKYFAPEVTILDSDSSIREFVEAAGTGFPVFIGFGLDESAILNLAIKYKKKVFFSVAKDFSGDIMSLYDFHKVPALVTVHPVYDEKSSFYGPYDENSLEDYIKQSLLPLVLNINRDSIKLLQDDDRNIVLTILEDEADEKSEELIKVLKAVASVNRDLIFACVGVKQWDDFTETFKVDKKTRLPKMFVWDGDHEYYTVIGCENLDESDMGTPVSRFLEGYRKGNVMRKKIAGLLHLSLVFRAPKS